MAEAHRPPPPDPGGWTTSQLEKHWRAELDGLQQRHPSMPPQRVQFQATSQADYPRVVAQWPELNPSQRAETWAQLIEQAQRSLMEIMPVCVGCGICCRQGSPALHRDDLDLVRTEQIPWNMLITLRRGEPARSPFVAEKWFALTADVIKIRERADSRACVFYDTEQESCSIYDRRPIQCRAQSCWDESAARALGNQPHLSRREIFGEIPPLLAAIEQHETQCSFAALADAFANLGKTRGQSVDRVIEQLAREESCRQALAEALHIPDGALDFLFGRSAIELTRLFGFRVETDTDGNRVLQPVPSQPSAP